MSNAYSTTRIRCPIGLFEPQEAKVEVLTKTINAARMASEKAPNARMLIDEVNFLLNCASYDRANQNCSLCRNFSELRFKTASLIVKVDAASAR
ncbi:MAG: hypothetical protein ABSD31_21555 [Candidatus Binataceae bacterium]|jgi:hypothetical protein